MRSGKQQSKEKRLKGEYNTKRKKKEGERPVKSAPSFGLIGVFLNNTFPARQLCHTAEQQSCTE